MPTSTDNPQLKYLPITFFINAAKVVQIERNTKEKQVFLYITEMQPIFERSSKVQISEKNTKEKSLKTYNTKPAMKVNMGAWRPMLPKLRIT